MMATELSDRHLDFLAEEIAKIKNDTKHPLHDKIDELKGIVEDVDESEETL